MNYNYRFSALVYTVRIPGFHPGGPGSIPGCGIFLIYESYTPILSLIFECNVGIATNNDIYQSLSSSLESFDFFLFSFLLFSLAQQSIFARI